MTPLRRSIPPSPLSPLALAIVLLGVVPAGARAADLPPHGSLRILIVGDEVNPHGLAASALTQPADLAAALRSPGSGLALESPDGLVDVSSGCVDSAFDALLGSDPVDVLIYFAHRAAESCDGGDAQPELTAAVESFLVGGGGVVVFHHGIFTASGKEEILALLGGAATTIEWNEADGQVVIDVAPGHFVTSNGVEYGGSETVSDPGLGISEDTYGAFTNRPDERYPSLTLDTSGGAAHELLFVSDHGGPGLAILGYELTRPTWSGRVIFYQPGEHQPDAVDDLDGNNFQILANAIVHVARTDVPVDGGVGAGGGGGGTNGGSADGGGASGAGGGGGAAMGSGGGGGASGDAPSGGCAAISAGDEGVWGALAGLLAVALWGGRRRGR